jgi:biotin operon repressor
MLAIPESNDAGTNHAFVQSQRLLRLIPLLESGTVWTTQRLAETLRVSRRTIYRDLRLLRRANIPVSCDPEQGGYRIVANGNCNCPNTENPWSNVNTGPLEDSSCKCPKLKADEIVALVLAIKVGRPPESIAGICDSALAKLLVAASPVIRNQALAILQRCDEPNGSQLLELRPSG